MEIPDKAFRQIGGGLLPMLLLAAALQAQSPLLNRNLVVNPGAEDGPGAYTPANPQNIPPGWTVTGGLAVARYGGSYFLFPSNFGPPDRGANYFYGGLNTGHSTATQTVDLSGAASDIDSGLVRFYLTGYLGFFGYSTESIDTISLKAEFLDAAGAVLLTATAPGPKLADIGILQGLMPRAATGFLLSNTRQARITIDLGNGGDYYFGADNVSLVLTNETPLGANLLVNGDGETLFPGVDPADAKPVPGWNANTSLTARQYGSKDLPALTDPIPANPGQYLLLCPTDQSTAAAYQTVDITAVKNLVDKNRVSYQFAGWLGGPGSAPDNATATLTLYDGAATPNSLGSINVGPVTQQDLGGKIGLQQRAATGMVPAGTRQIWTTLTFHRLRTDGLPGMGTADNFSLTLNAMNVLTVMNAAASQSGPVAPGEFVSVYGSSLGPATAVSSANMVKGLGNVKVTFNGIEAFLTYASATQINALVPYGVGSKADVVVEYGGQKTDPFPLQTAAASPGIFTLDFGPGQAWVVNQDNSFNSAGNPAPRGTIIAFWATGQGAVPGGVDGQPILSPNFPKPVLPVTVGIGGVKVDPAFAGLVYTGVMQVNVKVPDNTPVGNAVELLLSVGTATSRTGVVVAVK